MKMALCIISMVFIVGFVAMNVSSDESKSDQNPPTLLKCGKQIAEHVNISGSVFNDVNLAEATFENVNMFKTRMHNINLSEIEISAANLGGAHFKHLGPPPDKDGNQERQKAVTFEEAMLCDSTFTDVDMSNVKITRCKIDGMTIDGILVSDMIAAYKKQTARPK